MAYPKMNTDYMSNKKYNLSKVGSNRRKNKTLLYVVVHYTATEASAKNNCVYFNSKNCDSSADYFIDRDGSVYKWNPDCANYYTWHCGGGTSYGPTNRNSIGIEVVSSGTEYTQAQKDSLRALVTAIMADYGVPAKNVVRHYDCNSIRKLCPKAYCGSAAKDAKWKELHAYITGGKATTTTTSSTEVEKVNVSLDILKSGSTGEQVKTLQRLLNALGYNSGKADGIFGANTLKAVKTFQKAGGLTQDGVVGKDTWGALLGV